MSRTVELIGVSKQFKQEVVLREIDHTFETSKIHGIVGNNGSGKTVLMKCICGFMPVTSGRILVDGKEIGKDMDFPSDLGVIIETPGFLRRKTGKKNLEILASLNGKASQQQIETALNRVGLDPNLKKTVGQYSLGMRQRLGIAQAIMENASLLVLDEPMNGLDKAGRMEIRKLLSDMRDEGKTIILSSHLNDDIEVLCDTVCEVESGSLFQIRG